MKERRVKGERGRRTAYREKFVNFSEVCILLPSAFDIQYENQEMKALKGTETLEKQPARNFFFEASATSSLFRRLL